MSGDVGAACSPLNPIGCVIDGISDTLSSSVFGQLRDLMYEAVGQAAESLATLWVAVPTISVTASSGGSSPSGTVDFIQRSLWIVTITLLVVSLMIGGARMALERRGEPFMDVLKGLLTFVFVSGGGLFALGLVLAIVDELSEWILDRSTQGTDFGQNLGLLLTFPTAPNLGILMGTILGAIAVLVSIVQICLMVLRAAILPVLAGVWPTAAAFSGTASGRAWLQKLTSWIVAFAFYKLAVAIIYATAFRLMGEDLFAADGTGLIQAVAGVLLMIVAVVALPALVRLIAPMTAAVAGGGGGAGIAALGGAAMLASGAIHSGSSTSSPSTASGSVGTGGGPGPSGAPGAGGATSQPAKAPNASPGGANAGGTEPTGRAAAGGPAAPGGAPTPSRVGGSAGAAAGTGAGAAGAGAGAASGGGAAAGAGAAAAAGPAAPAVLGAQAALGAAQAVQSQVKQSAEGATGGPTGAQ